MQGGRGGKIRRGDEWRRKKDQASSLGPWVDSEAEVLCLECSPLLREHMKEFEKGPGRIEMAYRTSKGSCP